jgi:hypothetical protein
LNFSHFVAGGGEFFFERARVRVPASETRRKYIRVGSSKTSLFLEVSEASTHTPAVELRIHNRMRKAQPLLACMFLRNQSGGMGATFRDRERHGCRDRAYRDVLAACL